MSVQLKQFNTEPWFTYRGAKVCDVNKAWNNTSFVKRLEEQEYRAGDALLMNLASSWASDADLRDLARAQGKPLGLTADGHISFVDAFERMLEYRRMSIGDVKQVPGGITEAGYANAVKALPRNAQGALLMGTHLVAKMSMRMSRDSVELEILYHDIPCLGAGGNIVTCPSRSTKITIERLRKKDHTPVDKAEDVILKFLKFAMSMGKFSFPNICRISILVSGRGVTGNIFNNPFQSFGEEYKKKGSYALPVIDYGFRNEQVEVKLSLDYNNIRRSTDFLGALASCKYQPSFFGKTDNHYLGDYFVMRAMSTPFVYGATVAETAVNCINYCQENHWGPLYDGADAPGVVEVQTVEPQVIEPQFVAPQVIEPQVAVIPNQPQSSSRPAPVEKAAPALTPAQLDKLNNMDWSDADDEEVASQNASVAAGEFAETLSELKGALEEVLAKFAWYRDEHLGSHFNLNWDDAEEMQRALRIFIEEQLFNATVLMQSNIKDVIDYGKSLKDALEEAEEFALGWGQVDFGYDFKDAERKHRQYEGKLTGIVNSLARVVNSGDAVVNKLSKKASETHTSLTSEEVAEMLKMFDDI